VAERMAKGELLFSPIAHSHGIALAGAGGDWAAWTSFDQWMVERCDVVRVLQLDGWELSRGVDAEIVYATILGKPVEYVGP
jgi:hypothetical protein